MKRVFIDMDNVLVDFQSGLDQMSDEIKAEYAGRLDEIPGLFAKMKPMEGPLRLCMSCRSITTCSSSLRRRGRIRRRGRTRWSG